MRGVAVAAVFALWALSPVGAQAQNALRAAADSLLNPALHAAAETILLFEKKSENLGVIYESDSVREVHFTFTNRSNSHVTLTNVTTHCGCTAARFTKEPVAPGEKGYVVVSYNPKGRLGTIDTNAFVYCNATGRRPVAKLTLLGTVINTDEWNHLPVTMGALKLKRKKVSFAKGRTEARIPCANVGAEVLELGATLLPQYATFAVEPALLHPGEEGDIVITIDKEKAGEAKAFSFMVEGVACKATARVIKATIE